MFFYSLRVVSRGPWFDLPAKKKSAENRGDFSPRSREFFSAIAGIFLRDRGEFSPRSRRFFSAIAEKNPRDFARDTTSESMLTGYGFGVGVHGAHSYTGPPRGPDEVLVSLRLQASCGIEGSFLDAEQ